MHVFFDDQIFVAQEQGGISRYFTELARELGHGGIDTHVFAGITRNIYLPALRHAAGVTTRFRPRRDRLRINTWMARISRVWRRWTFAQASRHWPDVVYHATDYDVDPWIARRAKVTCLTVFDMIAERFCDERNRTRSLARKRSGVALADGIFCISEQTRRDFLERFPDLEPAVRVTPLAASLPEASVLDLKEATAHAPYLLMVGKRLGYKNGLTALRAFARLAEIRMALKLVCFGGEPFTAEEEAALDTAGVRARVVAVGGDDSLLAGFYTRAAALLYPSRYEGFGLPVLEAMQLGCPVITTHCGSLPEVAGDAAYYVDPDDVPGLAAAADRLLRDDVWSQAWVCAGHAQSGRFSWARTAGQTKATYEQLLSQPRTRRRTGDLGRVEAFSDSNRA